MFPFKPSDLSGKLKTKKALLERLGLDNDSSAPLIIMISRLAEHKGFELLQYIGEEMINSTNIRLAVLGTGEKKYEDYVNYLAYIFPGRVSANIMFDTGLADFMYAGADFLLMPSKSEPCGLSQLIAMRYGTIPIVRETGGLVDTVPPINNDTLEGRGITFKVYNAHDMLGAVKRAEALYYDKDKFKKIVSSVMRYDSGWKNAALQYMDVYEK